ncbi:MAG: biotin-dependent carboxyltransferase family protein [Bacteroidota bacterium]
MMKANVEVLHPGLWTIVVDQGRKDHVGMGIPVGGALDEPSAHQANRLVGNDLSTPLLEITWMGPRLLFKQEMSLALTGADLSPTIDGVAIPMNQTVHVARGAVLKFGRVKQGVRAYLAIRGEWEVPTWLGSASALPVELEYLLPEARLQKGSALSIYPQLTREVRMSSEEEIFRPQSEIAVYPGPEFPQFTRESIAQFFSHPYGLLPTSNRMGFRLEGPQLQLEQKRELISSGVMPGVIQVSHDGQPIILMADAQTSGGYPRIGVVATEAMQQVAQWQAGTYKRFVWAEK